MGWQDDAVVATPGAAPSWGQDEVIAPPPRTLNPNPPPESSGLGSMFRSIVRGVIPSAGGMAGFGAGAELAGTAGLGLPVIGETPIPALAGGLVGAYLGAEKVREIQGRVLDLLPDTFRRAIGQAPEQVQADVTHHPNYVMGGDIISNAPYMGVGGLTAGARAAARTAYEQLPANANRATRVLAHPWAAPVAGAGIGGATEAAAQLQETGEIDPTRVGIATLGGAAMSHETALGRKMAGIVPGVFGAWRARALPEVHPDTPATPDQEAQFGAFAASHGITDPNNVSPEHVTNMLNTLTGTEPAPTPTPRYPLQSAATGTEPTRTTPVLEELGIGGDPYTAHSATTPQFWANQNRVAGEARAAAEGDIDPSVLATAGRTPVEIPPVIQVTPAGQAIVDPGSAAGRDKFGGGRGLPVVQGEPPRQTGLWPDQLQAAQERVAGPAVPPRYIEGKGGKPIIAPMGQPRMEPNQFVAGEGRVQQTGAQAKEQTQAQRAFQLKQRQQDRTQDTTLYPYDTRTGGRVEGINQRPILLDGEFPVQEVGPRHFVKQGKKEIEHAMVQRYDATTGDLVPDSKPYPIAVSKLRSKKYTPEPRMMQDFQEAAGETPPPELPRMPHEGVKREAKQTFRETPQDNAEGPLPGGTPGRSQMPPQPEGPHQGPQRSQSEEEAIRDFERREQARRQQEEQEGFKDWGGPGRSGSQGRDFKEGDAQATNTPAGKDADGRWKVDERGYVVSDKGGPVIFPDQGQAGRWFIHKKNQTDQIFEIANHPSGSRFTVREAGRGEWPKAEKPPSSPTRESDGSADGASAAGERAPGALPPPREAPEPPPKGGKKKAAKAAKAEPTAEQKAKTDFYAATMEARHGERITSEQMERLESDVRTGKLTPQEGHAALERAQAVTSAREDVARSQKAEPRKVKGWSLLDEIRDKGGLKPDPTGDLGKALQDYKAVGKFNIVHEGKGAKSLNDMRRSLEGDGWFDHIAGGVDTDHKLVELIKQEAQGKPVRHPDYAETEGAKQNQAAKEAAELREEIDRSEIQSGDSPEVQAEKLAEYREKRAAEAAADLQANEAKIDAHIESLSPDVRDWINGPDPEDPYAQWRRPAEEEGGYEPGSDVGEGEGEAGGDEGGAEAFSEHEPAGQEHTGEGDNFASGDQRQADSGPGRQPEGEPAAAAEAERREPARRVEPEQTAVPGTEELTPLEMERRAKQKFAEYKQQNPRAMSGKTQKGHADEGLFGDQSEKAQTDMFKGEPDAADKVKSSIDLGKKMFSNPVGDPEVWRAVGEDLHGVYGWAKREAGAWAREWHKSMSSFGTGKIIRGNTLGERIKSPILPMVEWMERLVYSIDGQGRTLGARYNSPTMTKFMDLVNPLSRGGAEGPKGKGMMSATQDRTGQWVNRAVKVMKPFENFPLEKQTELLNQIGKQVQNPRSINTNTAVGRAAQEMRTILKEIHGYLKDAGVEVGEIEDYWPRMTNNENAIRNPEAFLKQATEAHMQRRADGAPGLKRKEAEAAAKEWLDRERTGGWGTAGNDVKHNLGNVFTQSRTLGKKADEIMADFFHRNPADVMSAYITRAVKKAEWSRRFGPRDKSTPIPKDWKGTREEFYADPEGKWNDMKAALIEESKASALLGENNPHLVNEAMGMMRTITGNSGDVTGASGMSRGALNLGRTAVALSYLPFSAASSLAEPVNIAIRTGNTLDVGRAYGEMVRQLIPKVRNMAGAKYVRELASDMGIIGDGIDELSQMQRVGTEHGSLFTRKITGKFFRANLLTQLTELNRIASVKIGMTFMRRLAKDVIEDTPYANISRKMLAELGIGADMPGKGNMDPVQAFASYVMDLDKPTHAQLKEHGYNGQAYQTALSRFVGETVMHPNAALKPRYAAHPLGGLVFQLQSFNYAQQKSVLNRVGAMTVAALNPKSGLNAQERAYAMMPLMNLVPLMVVAYAVNQMRDALLADPARAGKPPLTGAQQFQRTLSRSGVTGAADPLFNAIFSAKYKPTGATSILGPIASEPVILMDDVRAVMADQGASNSLERKLAADAYKMIVQPTLEAGVLAAVPQARLAGVGTAAVIAAAHPASREAFTRSFAGAPQAQ